MINKKQTVTIGIPAHNEAKNIKNVLNSILKQEKGSFIIKEVIVVCDGCTDKTASIVKAFNVKNNFIKVIDDKKRKGKSARVNEILQLNNSDILVCLDADVTLASNTIANIVKCFQDNKTGLVGGNDTPNVPVAFWEKVSTSWILHWQKIARPINKYNNPTNCPGRIYAMSREFARSFTIPLSIAADDHFVFYMAKSKNIKFKYCKDAVAYFNAPISVNDFIKQSLRFGKSGDDIHTHFKDITFGYSKLGKMNKIKSYLGSVLSDPIHFPIALLLQLYVRYVYNSTPKSYKGGQWESISSKTI